MDAEKSLDPNGGIALGKQVESGLRRPTGWSESFER